MGRVQDGCRLLVGNVCLSAGLYCTLPIFLEESAMYCDSVEELAYIEVLQ